MYVYLGRAIFFTCIHLFFFYVCVGHTTVVVLHTCDGKTFSDKYIEKHEREFEGRFSFCISAVLEAPRKFRYFKRRLKSFFVVPGKTLSG